MISIVGWKTKNKRDFWQKLLTYEEKNISR